MSDKGKAPGRHLVEGERYERAATVLDKFFTPAWRTMPAGFSSPTAEDFAQICVEHCYADAWSRETLDYKTRSTITLSALVAMGLQEELKMHVRAALTNGHKPDDVIEILIHLIPYVGVPKIVQAMRNAAEVFAQVKNS